MKVLFLEPFYGGSHKVFADGLVRHSRHTFDLVSLPARFWKWRMRGAALFFFRQIPDVSGYDALITTDLMSLADLKALYGRSCPPAMVYFHESQLTYPLAPGERMDLQYGFTDMTTALAAERVVFNSRSHREAFFKALPEFIRKMPEYRPNWAVAAIQAKSAVIYPGCDFPEAPAGAAAEPDAIPLIIWNHRWEFDKNPTDFFDALDAAANNGHDFRLALLGQNFKQAPPVFDEARGRFGHRIVQFGPVASRSAYLDWLRRGDIVISTALQENFGIAVVEAIGCGCLPLLPGRLSYPEIIPEALHSDFLYKNQTDLVSRLEFLLDHHQALRTKRDRLVRAMGRFAWPALVTRYDRALDQLGKWRCLHKTAGG